MTDIFISYSRKDIAFARLLHEALKKNGFDTWIDWQDIPPSTDWLHEVYTAIEEADTFIFILSSSSTISDICKLEIEHARKNNKRLIPIAVKDVDPSSVHPALAAINWIFSRTKDEFQPAIEDLIAAIKTDYEWAKAHTRLQMRALEWERANNDKSYLLRGADLDQAENWIAAAAEKSPEPTLLQTRYLQTSRQEFVKRQRNLLAAVGAALLVTIVLGVIAVINGQRAASTAVSLSTQVVVAKNAEATAEQEADYRATQQAIAETQTKIAQSRELAAFAIKIMEQEPDLGSLLAIESFKKQENFLSIGSLLQSLQTRSNISRVYHTSTTNPSPANLIISAVKFLPEGGIFATGDINGMIRFWDSSTGEEINPPITTYKGGEIKQFSISQDGKLLVSTNTRATQLWDIEKREEILTLIPDFSGNDAAFNPDGKFIATIQEDEGLIIWDIATSKLVAENKFESSWNVSISYSPDGSKILVFDGIYYDIKILDAISGKEIREPTNLYEGMVHLALRAVDINPKGDTLAVVDNSNNIYLYNYSEDLLISKIKTTQKGDIFDLEFSQDGKYFFTVDNNSIHYWNTKNGALEGILLSFSNNFSDVDISPNGQYMICVDENGKIFILSIYTTASTDGPFQGYKSTGRGIAFSPYDSLIAIATKLAHDDYAITLWDSESLSLRSTIPIDLSSSFVSHLSLEFLPENKLIYGGENDHTIHFYDLSTYEEIGIPITREKVYIKGPVLSPDGKIFASSDQDGTIILTNTATQTQIGSPLIGHDVSQYDVPDPSGVHNRGVPNYVKALAFSPDGAILISGGNDTTIRLWDVNTGKQIGEPLLGHTNLVNSVAFSPDGKILASSGEDEVILLWDIESKTQIGDPLKGHMSPIKEVVFSKNGMMLISAGQDGSIRLWDVESHQPIGQPITGSNARQLFVDLPHINPLLGYSGHIGSIYDIALSPDGTKLISVDGDDNIKIWELDVNIWVERSCIRAGRNMSRDEWNLYLPFEPYRKTCPQFP